MHPSIDWLTVSNVYEGQSLLVILIFRDDDVVRFDITVRYLINSVKIKKGVT